MKGGRPKSGEYVVRALKYTHGEDLRTCGKHPFRAASDSLIVLDEDGERMVHWRVARNCICWRLARGWGLYELLSCMNGKR